MEIKCKCTSKTCKRFLVLDDSYCPADRLRFTMSDKDLRIEELDIQIDRTDALALIEELQKFIKEK